MKNIKEFLKVAQITEEQFYGRERVGGSLDLRSLTSIPEGFNPTVGGYLYLNSLTSIPEGFNKSKFENQSIPFMKWGKGKGEYIFCDNRFSEVISKKGDVWKLKDVNKKNEYYLITDNKGKYAHGNSIKEAKEDLIYKITNRDKSEFKGMDVTKKLPFGKCIEMYRVITGACSTGTRHFIESKGVKSKSYSIKEIAVITKDNYGHKDFCAFHQLSRL